MSKEQLQEEILILCLKNKLTKLEESKLRFLKRTLKKLNNYV